MKEVKPYLKHILDECKFLKEKSEGLDFDRFNSDTVLKRAFVRSLEIIGKQRKIFYPVSEINILLFLGKKWQE